MLRGNLLIGGRYGDKIWAKDSAAVADEFVCTWEIVSGGVSQIEFRLRVGFVEFAPACIGARYNRTIHGIMHSEEMRPWSIGGAYDRPIPRRLAKRGLRREISDAPVASGHAHIVYRGDISASSLDSYRRFVKERNANVNPAYHRFWRTAATPTPRLIEGLQALIPRETATTCRRQLFSVISHS